MSEDKKEKKRPSGILIRFKPQYEKELRARAAKSKRTMTAEIEYLMDRTRARD